MEDLRAKLLSKRDSLASIIQMCTKYVKNDSIQKEDKKWHGTLLHCAQIEHEVINSFIEPGVKAATDLYVVDGDSVTFLYANMLENKSELLKEPTTKETDE